MAITANAAGAVKLTLRATPQFTASTLAEIQAAVGSAPATYEGKYIEVLDQPAGKQLYIFLEEQGGLIVANDQSGFSYDKDIDREKFFDSSGVEITDTIATMFFTATTDANGQVIVNATVDGTSGGTAMFSSIKNISARASVISANTYDMVYPAEYSIASGKVITLQMIRGSNTTVLIGGVVNSIRRAATGKQVLVTVVGIKATP